MPPNAPGWAVELKGEKIDLDDCREQLKQPFDPWVEDFATADGKILLLRTENWATFADAREVVENAGMLIRRINGAAMLVHDDARPLNIGQVMKFDSSGKREPFTFSATANLTAGRARLRGRVEIGGAAHALPPTRSLMQNWLSKANTTDALADLFDHLSRADNWYDTYKVMESIQQVAGKPATIGSLAKKKGGDWERVRRTANYHRHARNRRYTLPPNPPTLEEARSFLSKAALQVLPRA